MARRKFEDFEGYVAGDITYCVDPLTDQFFPVRICKIERHHADAESINPALTALVSPQFDTEPKNRRFVRPHLPALARFGGHDERNVNAERASGAELRLLPFHYGTYTVRKIKELHRENPELWPLPTGIVFERWFKTDEKSS